MNNNNNNNNNNIIIKTAHWWKAVVMGMSIGTMTKIVHIDTDYPPPCDGTTTTNDNYPLATHDPNMFKKVIGELSWKIKVSLSEGETQNFCQKQFIQRLCTILRESEPIRPLFKNNWVLKTHPAWSETKQIALFVRAHKKYLEY